MATKTKQVAKNYGTPAEVMQGFATASPTKGLYHSLMANMKKYSPLWWEVWHEWISQEDNNDYKKVAFQEFNKLQMKAIPSDLNINAGDNAMLGVVVLPRRDEVAAALPEQNEHQAVISEPTTREVQDVKQLVSQSIS